MATRPARASEGSALESTMLMPLHLALLVLLSSPPAGRPPTALEALGDVVDDQPLAADAGLDALISSALIATASSGAAAPDWVAIAQTPAEFRGRIFHFTTGLATRVAERAFGIDGLSAWQTSSPAIVEPILLLVYEPPTPTSPAAQATPTHIDLIELDAAFWKTAVADLHPQRQTLDQTVRATPQPRRILVFVGTSPRYTPLRSGGIDEWTGLVAALVVGGALLLIVRKAARPRLAGGPVSGVDAGEPQWNDAGLPDEPAEALAELRRRGEDTMTHE